jgi:phosphoribosylformylglycinamidine synthase PurS subunit
LKFSVTVTLKKDVLDPQGKYFELEINDNDQTQAEKKVDEMCKKLLANLIIEDYKINKI